MTRRCGYRVAGLLLSLLLVAACAPSPDSPEAPVASAPPAVTSVYTDLRVSACTTVELNEEEAYSVQRCPGVAGYELLLLEGDLRQSITVIAPDGTEHPLDYWSTITGYFSLLGEKAEWRVQGEGDAATPVALIVTVQSQESDDPENPNDVVYAAVARITPEGACVTDRILPGPEQADRARAAADVAGEKPCRGLPG